MTTRILAKAWLACAAAAAIFPTAAHSQALPAGAAASLSFSKSEAILGAPSALAAIMSQQHGGPAVPATLRPASYSVPLAVPAILRTGTGVSEGVFSGRPDVFGSVALRVDHTPLDARWHSVEYGRPSGAAGHFAAALTSDSPASRLRPITNKLTGAGRSEANRRHLA